ncbi:hypothetical protein BSZ39_08400 [Bowdeniella nasicola]|uniref:Dethiobiotin synthase n=1 Tax=Bowdeniella nasicola TaxID=208480 RepID=A0A1Q5Q183_9ACTO|nr:AAA family ATPase [Bowdeniella nasicola]OKL53633.1 hypothetical protein BSZ39_08400 [Bowdeniella nasicola]
MTIWIMTGTDTEIGKTMTTAALAALLAARGRRVAIDKPAQTGMSGADELGDAALARRLSGAAHASEGVRLNAPLAPVRAALEQGTTLPGPDVHTARIRALAYDDVLVEGSGGLLVELAPGWDTGLFRVECGLMRPDPHR